MIRYVKVTNHCTETINIFFRFLRETKVKKPKKVSIRLFPGETSDAIPYPRLVGAKGWQAIEERQCVEITTVDYEPQFILIRNETDKQIELPISVKDPKRPRRKVGTFNIAPQTSPKPLYKKSLLKRSELNKLIDNKSITIKPFIDIGPKTSKNPEVVGSYYGEDVYICYKCGRPIVFRGYPPTPIHV